MGNAEKLHLLIVEPDPEFRASLTAYLDSTFDVMDVARGDEGLAFLVDHPVDAVLTEMDLPGELGISVLTEFRQRCPDGALVAIYGYGDRFQRLEPMVRRVADVLVVKPVELAKLEQTLVSLCATRSTNRPDDAVS